MANLVNLSTSQKYCFGPELLANGRTRFRLWAPSAHYISLFLVGSNTELPMEKTENGWFEIETNAAPVGTQYYYVINKDLKVPDPASRYQPNDVHGPSEVVDNSNYHWHDKNWQGLPWEKTVLYELHVGTFTPAGTYLGVIEQLEHLKNLGVTAIELLPVSDFPGSQNWGYDGVLHFAPESSYGRPEDLKALVDSAHQQGIMVFMDVVYNHFGPDGNYLHTYAEHFFTEKHHTPWGAAINYDDVGCEVVREFMVQNALYWLEEFHMDGLRLDAVDTILDNSEKHFLEELAETVGERFKGKRPVHLIMENQRNDADLLVWEEDSPRWFNAQWNDDIHHALHCLITGESYGYYGNYAKNAIEHLGKCLTQGFSYQGEPDEFNHTASKGKPSGHLRTTAFVSFLQNHDQVANHAERGRIVNLASLEAVRAAVACYLLAPAVPMLFMGEEWGAEQPFPFFCDFCEDLAMAVREGRIGEFSKIEHFSDPAILQAIPEPNAKSTFQLAILNFEEFRKIPRHSEWLAYYQQILRVRHEKIVPLLQGGNPCPNATYKILSENALEAQWCFPQEKILTVHINFGKAPLAYSLPPGNMIASSQFSNESSLTAPPTLLPETTQWFLT